MWRPDPRSLGLLVALLGAACVPIPTPTVTTVEAAPAPEITALLPGEAIAVLPTSPVKAGWSTACVTRQLSDALPGNRVMDADAARDALFPWLEARSLPSTDSSVRELLARPAVTDKLSELRLRYLLLISHADETTGDGLEGVIAGVSSGRATHRVAVRAIDVENDCCRPGGTVRATGARGWVHVGIYGLVLVSFPETAACHAAAEGILAALRPAPARPAESTP